MWYIAKISSNSSWFSSVRESVELVESPSIDPSHFPPNHLCFQPQPSDKWSGKQTEISFNTEPQILLAEDKNTDILLAEGGDISNEAASTAISIVKPQRILTNLLLLEQQIFLADIYFPIFPIYIYLSLPNKSVKLFNEATNTCYWSTNKDIKKCCFANCKIKVC